MLNKTQFLNTVGKNIRKIRTDKGLTQDELADRCGFYRTYINLIETSKRLPSSFSLYKVAKGLGTTIGELYPDKK
jgi:transcriptional regulator with XRE-family HTH domain